MFDILPTVNVQTNQHVNTAQLAVPPYPTVQLFITLPQLRRKPFAACAAQPSPTNVHKVSQP
jgi:hypothetical protein